MMSPDRDLIRTPKVKSLYLQDFRSYAQLSLDIGDAMVVAISGENGAGKTNILEALSLFSPGRGLRRADASDIPRASGAGSFAVSIDVDSGLGSVKLGTGVSALTNARRMYRIDREPASSARAFADHLRVVWLTPAPARDRRSAWRPLCTGPVVLRVGSAAKACRVTAAASPRLFHGVRSVASNPLF